MPVASGSQLGHYAVLGPIGGGGMGRVYRGRDERLGRDVALKVLPDEVRGDPERLARFEREARAAGALNHPNVLVVHDVGADDGTSFMVTELLDGATLRERMRDGPVPLRKALDWAVQIARGLGAAHDKCIVHRDLKPENLFITRDGVAKILDFGLARSFDQACPLPGAELQTEPDAVVGTAGYMAPEQVRGRPADARSDVFAFGAVLYELLAGRRAFDGETGVERGYAILSRDPPDFAQLGVHIPTPVERLVRRCLEKAPDDRFQSARDLSFALEAVAEGSSPDATPVVTARRRQLGRAALATLVLTLGVAGAFLGGRATRPPQAPAAASSVEPARGAPSFTRLTFRAGYIDGARFAPDGHTVVYSGGFEAAPPSVYSVVPRNPESRSVAGAWTKVAGLSRRGEMALLQAPKDDKVGDWGWTLARADLAGGAPREVAEGVAEADWGPDGESLLAVRIDHGRWRLEYPIGHVLLDTAEWIVSPRVSPAGDAVAFLSYPVPNDDRGAVELVRRDGTRRALTDVWLSVAGLAWSPDGREVWFTGSNVSSKKDLWAVDLAGHTRLLLQTASSLVLRDVAPDGRVLASRRDVRLRMAGTLAGGAREADLSWFDGSVPAALSADGSTLLFTEGLEAACMARRELQAYVRRADGSPAVRVSQGKPWALSPDGQWALVGPVAPFTALRLVPTGPGQARDLPPNGFDAVLGAAFFPDGKRVLLCGREPNKQPRIFVLDLGNGSLTPLWKEGVLGGTPPSPDGKLMAAVDEQGVWIVPLDGSPPRKLEHFPEHHQPIQWTSDGKSLVVRHEDSRHPVPAQLLLLDVATGTLKPWRTVYPPAPATEIGGVFVTADLAHYVYGYPLVLDDLELVEGLR